MRKHRKTAAAVFAAALLALALSGPAGSAAAAAAADPLVSELQSELDLGFFDRYWGELEREVGEYLPGLSWKTLLERLQAGEAVLEPGALLGGLGRFFFGEVLLNFKLLGQLLLLAVAAAFLKNLESAFERQQVAALTRSIVFIVLAGVCLYSFTAALTVAGRTIEDMVDFSLASLPALLALLAAQGSVASSAVLHPLVIFGINFFGSLIRNVIFPLIYFSALLGLAHHFSPHFKVGKLSDLFKELSMWGMGICMTVFVGILAVQGVAGTVADAVGLRTAKYMTGAFVPVVGKILSDAVETVAGASILLKNSIYLTGVVMLLLLTLFPLLKLTAVTLIYKVSAALVEPIGESELGSCINVMGNSLVLVLAAMACAALIFFFAVTSIVGAGNTAIMFR